MIHADHTMVDSLHFDHTARPLATVVRWMLWLGPALVLALLALAGCDNPGLRWQGGKRYYVKPTVAVLSFQAAASPMGWQVGDGLADVLTDELVKTGRFNVVERANIGAVLGELQMQRSPVTRTEGKAQAGRLKNVEYLIKGRVTDFGHVSSDDAWARLDMLNVFGARHRAVLRMTFSVVEVESGQIAASRTVESWVRTGQTDVSAAYKNIGFGGSTFYRTPLGRATASATRRAVREITAAVANRPWQPRIALIRNEQIIINGGLDRGVKPGACYQAFEFGEAIVDPSTGDVLGRLPGAHVGKIEITEVHDRYAVARPLSPGLFQVGQHLAPIETRNQ